MAFTLEYFLQPLFRMQQVLGIAAVSLSGDSIQPASYKQLVIVFIWYSVSAFFKYRCYAGYYAVFGFWNTVYKGPLPFYVEIPVVSATILTPVFLIFSRWRRSLLLFDAYRSLDGLQTSLGYLAAFRVMFPLAVLFDTLALFVVSKLFTIAPYYCTLGAIFDRYVMDMTLLPLIGSVLYLYWSVQEMNGQLRAAPIEQWISCAGNISKIADIYKLLEETHGLPILTMIAWLYYVFVNQFVRSAFVGLNAYLIYAVIRSICVMLIPMAAFELLYSELSKTKSICFDIVLNERSEKRRCAKNIRRIIARRLRTFSVCGVLELNAGFLVRFVTSMIKMGLLIVLLF